MICDCDEAFGRRFFSHQLDFGVELETQRRVQVSLGFQKDICNSCRGIPEEAHPVAEIHGRTSKIRRYYWREIFIETTKRFGDWQESDEGQSASPQDIQAKRKSIENEVTEEIQILHAHSPKYVYIDQSQSEIIDKYQIEVVNLEGIHEKKPEGYGLGIVDEGGLHSPEEFVSRYFQRLGYDTLFTESIPFHVLFGVFMWIVIQDPKDTLLQPRGFGDRATYEDASGEIMIWTLLPPDFGTSGYFKRRALDITAHLNWLPKDKDDLLWTFDYWIEPSSGLRNYLWAHQPQDVSRARKIISILPTDVILRILHYLMVDYWRRFCGWPDLLVYKENEFLFIEVKSSRDRLREDQKVWIRGNYEELFLPFKLVKIHNKSTKR
jgi:hypothetical protein